MCHPRTTIHCEPENIIWHNINMRNDYEYTCSVARVILAIFELTLPLWPLKFPIFSQVYVENIWTTLLCTAAKYCPPLLNVHSWQLFIPISLASRISSIKRFINRNLSENPTNICSPTYQNKKAQNQAKSILHLTNINMFPMSIHDESLLFLSNLLNRNMWSHLQNPSSSQMKYAKMLTFQSPNISNHYFSLSLT